MGRHDRCPQRLIDTTRFTTLGHGSIGEENLSIIYGITVPIGMELANQAIATQLHTRRRNT